MEKKIVITGFPYAFPYYWKVFESLKNKNDFVFILPKFWQAKKGKVQIKLEPKEGFTIYGAKAMSYGGKSLYGGLFKGWMPAIGLKLPYLRLKYGSSVLYSCSEPNLLTTLYNGIFARLFGYKHVIFTWQNISPEARMSGLKLKFSNALVKLNLSLSDGIICGNKKAEEVIKKLDSNIKTTVSPLSGVDIDKFQPRAGSHKNILFYGVLDDRKGVNIIIEAFANLQLTRLSDGQAAYNPQPKLVIIGTGPEKDNLVALAEKLGVKDKIDFYDWMKNEELPNILSNASVFVYPSVSRGGWEEQFGYAMGEASASGIPVVATRTGSIEEVVKDGETGILIKPNSADELKSALDKLLSDDALRKRMGEAGREFIVKNFSHQAIADKINNFLNQFI